MDRKLFVEQCLERAKALYDEAEVYMENSVSSAISLYNGDLDEFELAEIGGIQLLVCKDNRWAQAYSEEIGPEAIDFLLEKVAAGVEVAEATPERSLYVPAVGEIVPEVAAKESFKFEADEVMRSLKKLNSTLSRQAQEQGEEIRMAKVALQYTSANSILCNSLGLERETGGNYALVYVYLVVARGDEMKSGIDFQVLHNLEELDAEKLAKAAMERALETYGAKSTAPGKYRVVLDQETFAQLLVASLSMAFSAEQVQKGLSLLQGKLGQQVASDCLAIYDFPASEENPVPLIYDGEGVPTQKLPLIENGKLSNYLYNLETARKDGKESTGSASRSYKSQSTPGLTFMYVEPGEKDFAGLLAEVGDGLLITDIQGLHSGLDPISGDYSLPAVGFLIKDGKKDRPVNQITIAGNILDTLRHILELGSDAKFTMMGHYAPSVIIDDIAVSGEA
ncbi:MAG: metallopeptidase TldD-related protein [Eubacteriales bacterium]|nr:metallopeptidase TldD-related protein [Eubacteriales bacterium]